MLFPYQHIMEIQNSREKHIEHTGKCLVTPSSVGVSWEKHVWKKLDTSYAKRPTWISAKAYSIFDNQT